MYYPAYFELCNIIVNIMFNFEYLFVTEWLVPILFFTHRNEFPYLIFL